MSSQIFIRAKACNRSEFKWALALGLAISLACPIESSVADGWRVDLSRRIKESPAKDASDTTSSGVAVDGDKKNFLFDLFDSSEPQQELVILNSEHGFVPATVRVRSGGNYRIHVVNVNEKEKNVSFVLDSFSESHATYFGKIKTFDIRPKKNGVFRFSSPETSAQGRLVVYPAAELAPESPAGGVQLRTPSSSEGE